MHQKDNEIENINGVRTVKQCILLQIPTLVLCIAIILMSPAPRLLLITTLRPKKYPNPITIYYITIHSPHIHAIPHLKHNMIETVVHFTTALIISILQISLRNFIISKEVSFPLGRTFGLALQYLMHISNNGLSNRDSNTTPQIVFQIISV